MNLRDVCRLLLTTSFSNREVARAIGIAPNTAGRYRKKLSEEGLNWISIANLTEHALEDRLNGGCKHARKNFVEPDFAHVFSEMRRPGVTLTLLHEEYAASAGGGAMSESEFRRRFHRYQRSLGVVMRQPHAPGYRLFLDFSGKRPRLTNLVTGEETPVELFVAVMGASRKTFAYAVPTQRLADWCDANVKALEFFRGAPKLLVPDNLKSAVDKVTVAEGHIINYTYSKLAQHYDCIVLPTRIRRPKDKAAVEIGVRLAQRWILARLRNRIFTSIEELNGAIAQLLDAMNGKSMRGHGGKSRNQLFDELDLPALQALPELPFEFADWKLNVTVPQDYHVVWDDHFYSVPHTYIGFKVRLRVTARQVEVYVRDDHLPIATHLRSELKGQCTTRPEHQPAAHRAYAQDQLADLIAWAERSGPWIALFVKKHINTYRRRPALSIQAMRGLRSIATQYGTDRLDAACHRALLISTTSVSSVRSMLARKMECAPLRGANDDYPLPGHENIRGSESYDV